MNESVQQSPRGFRHKSSTGSSYSQTDDDPKFSASRQGVKKVRVSRSKSVGRNYFKWFFWSGAFVLTATISAALGATLALITPLSPLVTSVEQGVLFKGKKWSQNFPYHLARPVNILVLGIDKVPDTAKNSPEVLSGRSDTMLLLRCDPTDESVKLLSIPRDTQVEIPGVGISKINDANVEGGPALTARVVSKTLNNVQIDRYVRVTTDAFRELVDLVGGVEVFVPQPMQYQDFTQNLEIDLEEGWQTLNGDQAEQFARFRDEQGGDIARVQRQQILLKALRKRLVSPTVLPRLPKLIRVMQQYIDTNLSLEEILALVGFSLNLEQDDFQMVLLPGRFSRANEYLASYWIMDQAKRDEVMLKYFEQKPEISSSKDRRSLNRVRIAIQNATDNPELPYRVVQYLAEQEFYNVYIVQDWSDHLRQTEIIVQQGDLEAAANLEKVLGLGHIEPSSIGDLRSELTLRLGEDLLEKEF
ncbi:MAG: LCP family protein [Coleofasciculaceae cyanobacterium]